MTTPALFNLLTTVESYGGCHPCKIFEPAVVGTPFCARTSLSARGIPAIGESFSPLARRASTFLACASAPSVSTCKKAFTWPSTAATRSRCACVNSTEVVSPFARASAIWAAVLLIILLHPKFVAHENVTLLVPVLPRAHLQEKDLGALHLGAQHFLTAADAMLP